MFCLSRLSRSGSDGYSQELHAHELRSSQSAVGWACFSHSGCQADRASCSGEASKCPTGSTAGYGSGSAATVVITVSGLANWRYPRTAFCQVTQTIVAAVPRKDFYTPVYNPGRLPAALPMACWTGEGSNLEPCACKAPALPIAPRGPIVLVLDRTHQMCVILLLKC